MSGVSSREISKLIDRQHCYVIRDIERLFDFQKLKQAVYLHRGNTYLEYLLTRDECEELASSYDVVKRGVIRARIKSL